MPVFTAAACIDSELCPVDPFPQATGNCNPTTSVGGINDLYFVPCTEVVSEANLLSLAWWQNLVDTGTLGSIGVGLGSIGKKSDKKERVSSCSTEQITQIIWALTYKIKLIDKTSERITTEQANALILKFGNYQLIARMCEGENSVLPVGAFTTSDVNWTVPDNFEETQEVLLEFSWPELGLPRTYDVAGLSAVVPKAKMGVAAPGSSNS